MALTPRFPGPTPRLSAQHSTLRPVRSSDLPVVHEGLSDRRVTRYYAVHYDTLDQTVSQMRWFARNETSGAGRWWAMCDARAGAHDGAMMGACGFNAHNNDPQSAALGYWMLPRYWGQGLMRDALTVALDHAFGTVGLSTVAAEVEPANVRSQALLARLGFHRDLPASTNEAWWFVLRRAGDDD